MIATEANFDGLVGPTHNYSGLAQGNLASAKNAQKPSNPREAALQGLAKMRALSDLGLHQGVLPPQERPHLATLRSLGFGGRDADLLQRVLKEAPGLLAATASASSMWTANAATVSPSADTADRRVHFTPANLATHLHRSLEPPLTARALAATFPDTGHFAHHAPLPGTPDTADEGAANHTRLAPQYGDAGVEVFVYGRGGTGERAPEKFPARQTRAASEAVARLHGLSAARTVFVQQSPDVIDAGVFHNDVIAVGNRAVWLAHEKAFADPAAVRTAIERAMPEGTKAVFVTVTDAEVPVADAVSSYLFNSQLVCPPSGPMVLVCAAEVRENPRAWAAVQRILEDAANPIGAVQVFDLRQSMHNGGGPACLRLRVVLTEAERAAVNARSWLDAARHAELEAWVRRHYRDHLVLDDLADPQLLDETRTALDRLTQILGLGSLYDFQRN